MVTHNLCVTVYDCACLCTIINEHAQLSTMRVCLCMIVQDDTPSKHACVWACCFAAPTGSQARCIYFICLCLILVFCFTTFHFYVYRERFYERFYGFYEDGSTGHLFLRAILFFILCRELMPPVHSRLYDNTSTNNFFTCLFIPFMVLLYVYHI